MTDDSDDWGYGMGGIIETPVEEAYPKPVVLTPKEEQDRLWRLVEQYSKN